MNQTLRYSLIYGGLAGAVLAVFIAVIGTLHERVAWVATMTFGYSIMLVAMSFVFVGVKRYRDVERGGVIGFWRALGLGLAIAAIAGILYVLIWEAYLAVTNYVFIEDFIAGQMRAARAAGKSAAELARMTTEFDALRIDYANPLFRLPMTLVEILPVALLVSLFSAGLLCNPKVFPARSSDRPTRNVAGDDAAAASDRKTI